MKRQPVALANWKMEMTIAESLAYLRCFQDLIGDLLGQVQIVLFPPYTALHALAQTLGDSSIELGVQTISAAASGAHTGEISARLAADAGARWAQLGHWELRRHQGVTEEAVNHKVHRALEAGLRPNLLVGEARDVEASQATAALERQLERVLAGCPAEQVGRMIFVYEPEWTIGAAKPASAVHVQAGCRFIRHWLADRFGQDVGNSIRLVYGGSVTPANVQALLALPDLDGLGAGRKGRDPESFAQIVRLIAQTHHK